MNDYFWKITIFPDPVCPERLPVTTSCPPDSSQASASLGGGEGSLGSSVQRQTILTDPKTGGKKGTKSARYDLIPSDSLDEVAKVYGYGASIYAPRNWECGYAWGLSIAALERHVSAFKQRQDIDPESGLPHLAHAVFHCLSLMRFMRSYPDGDDRSK
jgi:hypothetical protein